jgi:trehalose-6-phosphatase
MEAAELLAPLASAPGRSALVLDVDGTLAPIVARPELAAVPAET